MAEAGALSEAVKPLKSDGAPDAEVTARLSVRHDDSPQNVANRLALWDSQVGQHGEPILMLFVNPQAEWWCDHDHAVPP